MKKTILKRILALVIVFMMFISTPFSVFGNLYNNHTYVYASTFAADIESEMFKQLLIPTLISAGLVFTTKEAIDNTVDDLMDHLHDLGFDWRDPEEPEGPTLGEIIKKLLKGVVVWNAGKQLFYNLVEIPKEFWKLIKSFVDTNYDEGNNTEIPIVAVSEGTLLGPGKIYIIFDRSGSRFVKAEIKYAAEASLYALYVNNKWKAWLYKEFPYYYYEYTLSNGRIRFRFVYDDGAGGYILDNHYDIAVDWIDIDDGEIAEPYIIGTPGIVDNHNYDWNNSKTGIKTIPIPLETDINGNPKVDENGYYLPSIDTDSWVDVQPVEIPNLDPTGTPIQDIPPFPDIENPDDDEKTGIMIYIGNILQLIVGQLSKIVEGVNTIVANTNQMIFGTPNPVFDPTTGQQIDPETGEPIPEPEPETEVGSGIIGDGIDTNIPTDFEWGDFKHLLDIFYIFIYFIVILILILLKFLSVVFTGLPAIPANTELFTQYPEILEGVNYVKNLKVGGMSITVQQAFEYVFMVFFYIFVIKQIRKLYNSHVYEESAEDKSKINEMKMDYYDKH